MPSVLVIGDERGTLATFGTVLRGAGFDVALASTGREGLRLARSRTVDLVLTDLRLADMTGLEVLDRLRRESFDVPFVIMTGPTSTAPAADGGPTAAAFVEKPLFADRLLDVVRSHLSPVSHSSLDGRGSPGRANVPAIRAVRMIEERYDRTRLNVRSVASELSVSTEHLCRSLKRQTGYTFGDLLRSARVRAACQLLRATTLSMKQIADRVGFISASQFDRDFKRVCGVSPSDYRIDALRQPQALSSER